MKVIIFDFGWTIYNPDTEALVPHAKKVLQELKKRGFTLYIITCIGKSKFNLVNVLGIRKYFRRVIPSPNKDENDFQRLIKSDKRLDRATSFVIGDRVRKEILYGNRLGLQTVWVRAGRFADEIPHDVSENPTYIVPELKDVLRVVY